MKILLQRRRTISKLLVCVLMVATILSGFVYSEESQGIVETSQNVGPGTYYRNLQYATPNGRYVINTLEAAIGTEYLKIEASDGGSPIVNKTVTHQALVKSGLDSRVIGAVNGDFFDMSLVKGLTYGTSIINGEIKSSVPASAIFGVKQDGSCFVDTLKMDATISYGNVQLPVTSVNKLRWINQAVIYTPAFGSTTLNTVAGLDVVVRGVPLPLQPNRSYTGAIEKVITDAKNTEIPADGVVLSISGPFAQSFLAAAVGDKVSFQVNYDEADLKHVVSGAPRLIEQGMPSPDIAARQDAKERHPRTAIGLKDGSIFMITVDGRQPGLSDGMNLYELTEFLIGQGVQEAINLDGGGSSAMVVRKQGAATPYLVNKPSDGRERSVGNSIQLVSAAPVSEPVFIGFNDENVKLYKNSSYKPTFYSMDRFYNPSQIDIKQLKYTADPKTAKASKDGIFTAGSKAGVSYLDVTAGKARGRLPIQIVDTVSSLVVLNRDYIKEDIHLEPGEKFQLKVLAFDENGREIIISPGAIKWEVANAMGKVDANGVFTAGAKAAAGKVKAIAGTAMAELDARVGKSPVIVADFANVKTVDASAVRGKVAVRHNQAKEPVKTGKISLRLDYDFTGTEGTSAAYVSFKEPVKIIGKPTEVGVWLYGDGSSHWVRGTYVNAKGERKVLNLTAEHTGVDWKGWKFAYAEVPRDEAFPIKLEQIYAAEPVQERKNKGVLYLDDVIALYKPDKDYFSPVVTAVLPENGKVLEASPKEVAIMAADKGTGINPASIQLLMNGKAVKVKFDAKSGKITYTPSKALAKGEYAFKLAMKDKAGNLLNPGYQFKFTVK